MTKLSKAPQTLNALLDLLKSTIALDVDAKISQRDHDGGPARPELYINFTGPDTHLLTDRNGELLHALEHIAAKVLGLEPEEHDLISFDADNFKLNRDRALQQLALTAIVKVRTTARAYVFPPMMSRERRLLHLALASSGLKSASTGERFHRSVVLYPDGVQPPPK